MSVLAVPTFAEAADFTDCYIGYDEMDPEARLYDSRTYSRGQARSYHSREFDIPFTEVEMSVTYAAWFDRAGMWENGGRDQWVDDHMFVLHPDFYGPDDPPEGWTPDVERLPSFWLCKPTTPGAVKVWRCEVSS